MNFMFSLKFYSYFFCSFDKKNYLCTAIKAGSVAQLDRATPF